MGKISRGILIALAGAGAGVVATRNVMESNVKEVQNLADKHLSLYLMMNQWVKIKQDGKNVGSFLEKNGYKRIAIYGMSYAGETLVEELVGTNVEIAYCVDKNAGAIDSNIEVRHPDEELAEVDAVVVTAINAYYPIREMLRDKMNCPILSLEEILYNM